MVIWLREWWSRLLVQQKVWTILLALFVPLVATLCVHVTLITHLLSIQQQHRQTDSTLDEILVLRRLAAGIEDAFRGYVLTAQEVFLKPLEEVQAKLQSTITQVLALTDAISELAPAVDQVHYQAIGGPPGVSHDIRRTCSRTGSSPGVYRRWLIR